MIMTSNLKVENREKVGKGNSRALRREGKFQELFMEINKTLFLFLLKKRIKSRIKKGWFF